MSALSARFQQFLAPLAVAVAVAGICGSFPSAALADDGAAPVAASGPVDAAAAVQAAAAGGDRVQVTAADTATETTWANPDGTFTTEDYATPIRTERDGALVPIDATLTRQPGGTIEPTATDLDVSLGGGGSLVVATLGIGNGALTYAWPTPLPQPVLAGSTATYVDVLPDTDLKVTVSDTTFETSFVVKSPAADLPSTIDMPVSLDGLVAAPTTSGAVGYLDSTTNEPVGQSLAAQVWDSNRDDATGSADTSSTSVTLTAADGSALPSPQSQPDTADLVQEIEVPDDVLNDPNTRYPVTVDPEVTNAAPTPTWTYIDSAHPNQSYYQDGWDDNHVHMGRDPSDTTSLTRPMWLFRGMNVLSANIEVLNAQFSATSVHTSGCAAPTTDLWTTDYWDSSTTWNNPPAATNRAVSVTLPKSTNSHNSCGTSTPPYRAGFDITDIISAQSTANKVDVSIQLREHNENDTTQWQKWNYDAAISYTYVYIPTSPTGAAFTSPTVPCATSASSVPYVDTDADADTDYAVTFHARYTIGGGGNLNAGYIITAAGSSTWIIPRNTSGIAGNYQSLTLQPSEMTALQNGGTYRLETYGWVHTNYGNVLGPSVYCDCKVLKGAPATPQLTSPGVTSGGAIDGGTAGDQFPSALTFAAPASSDHVVRARWSWTAFGATAPDVSAPCGGSYSMGKDVVTYLCPDAGGTYTLSSVSALRELPSTLYVQYLNAAGTASTVAVTPNRTDGLLVNAVANNLGGRSAVSPTNLPSWRPLHVWLTGTGPVGSHYTFNDVGSVGSQTYTGDAPTPLTLNGGATVGTPATAAAGDPTPTGSTLSFTDTTTGHGAGTQHGTIPQSTGTTTGVATPWDKGFTVGAWVRPHTSADLFHHAVLSQQGTNNSGFILRSSYVASGSGATSVWEFCVANDVSSGGTTQCVDAVPDDGTVQLDTWTFVAGTWDPVNKQIRITTTSGPASGGQYDVVAAPAQLPSVVATGDVTVGRAEWAAFGGNYDDFNGQIADPFVAPRPMTPNQLLAQRQRTSS